MNRLSDSKKIIIPVVCALAALCGGAWVVMGQTVFTEFTGVLTPLALVAPGTVECPGGQPTGLWPAGPPCSPLESRVRVRGLARTYQQVSSDSRVSGRLTVVINANFDGWPGSGPMWGTATIEAAPGAVWQGAFTGERTLAGETIHAVLHGTGGTIEGLKVHEELSRGTTPLWSLSGRIIQPGGK